MRYNKRHCYGHPDNLFQNGEKTTAVIMISCPVCHSSETALWSVARDYEYHSTTSEYNYYHCNSCQTIFIHPVPLNELHVIYPSNYYSFVNSKKNIVTNIKEAL